MIRRCAWCGRSLGPWWQRAWNWLLLTLGIDARISDGVCDDCNAKHFDL